MKNKLPDIQIIGLGPGDPGLLTRKAWDVISSKEEIYLRTAEHPTIADLPTELIQHSFDHIYREESSYEQVYKRIVEEIIQLAIKSPGILYAVPGDPLIAEATTEMILVRAREEGLSVEILPGVSFLEPVFAALEMDPLPQITILDALELAKAYFPPFPPDKPTLIAQIYSREIASNTKLTLMANFPDHHPVYLIHDAGSEAVRVEKLALYEIDRSRKINNRTALFIPPLEKGSSLESFQEIIAHLRAPEGCPWDREQDHQTLRPNLLEETYETLQAIDANDPVAMQEEFGDLLLQIILHAQIASEFGEFTMSDLIRGIYQKIVQRHPHVFEDLKLNQSDEVIRNWERIKSQERKTNSQDGAGILDGVPVSLPALTQAQTYQKRAARFGFDWKDINDVLEKIPEEIQEIKTAQELTEKTSELGDLLFSIVNAARWMEIDPESALREANQRFKNRFTALEEKARDAGRELSDMTLAEMDQLWEQVKQE